MDMLNLKDLEILRIEENDFDYLITADLGDWIIKGMNGEFYPCKLDIFDKTYEAAE